MSPEDAKTERIIELLDENWALKSERKFLLSTVWILSGVIIFAIILAALSTLVSP